MRRSLSFGVPVILAFLLLPVVSFGTAPVRLAILPFQVHSNEDLGFLQKGIADMLASRIGRGGGIEVIPTADVLAKVKDIGPAADVSGAAALGRSLGAEFVVFGSITKLGEHISLDGQLLDTEKGKRVGQLFGEAANLDGVIPQVGRLASEIRRTLLGPSKASVARATGTLKEAPRSASTLPQEQILSKPPDASSRVPPGGYPVPPGGFTGRGDDIFTRSDAAAAQPGGKKINPAFIMGYEADKARRGYVKAPTLGIANLVALACGDTDGDGRVETVVADSDRLYIYKDVLGDPTQKANVRLKSGGSRILSLDVADINKNGAAEIYVTAVAIREEIISSEVVEYRDGAYRTLATKLPYLFRVTNTTLEGPVLLGQEKRPRLHLDRYAESTALIYYPPHRMKWDGDSLVMGEQLPIKEDLSVLGLTMVDVDHDTVSEYLAYDLRDHLKLLNARGKVVWESDEPYGRSANFLFKKFNRVIVDREDPQTDKIWLPARILTRDLDRDGFEEVIVCHNYEPLRILSNTRFFTKGAVFSLGWDGFDFLENWRTREFKGYVGDFDVADVDNDGKPELLVGMIHKSSTMDYFKSKASLISFDLNIERAKKQARSEGTE